MDSGAAISQQLQHESYPVHLHRMGGREPDGEPTFLGKWTFQPRTVRTIVEGHLEGRVLNACAGKTRLEHGTGEIVRNDLNEDITADYHYDVCTIDEHFPEHSFDVVILDPPFDAGQAEKLYEGFHAKEVNAARQALAKLVKPGGKFLEFGWNSHGASAYTGWNREELHIFQRGPCLGDVFCVVERNYQTQLPGDSR